MSQPDGEPRQGLCSDFWQLPELVALFTSYIKHPDDLKVLCLTSRLLREAAMAQLHRRLVIDPSKFRQNDSILIPGHVVHKHTRQLIIKNPCHGHEAQWHQNLLLLLLALPENRLELLSTPMEMSLRPNILRTIFERQRALKYIQIGHVYGKYFAPEPALPALEGLEISARIVSLYDLDLYGNLLRNSRRIRELSVLAHRIRRKDGVLDAYNNILLQLFGRVPQEKFPLQIDRLLLSEQKLLPPECVLTPHIAMENLRELQVHECYNVGYLLEELTQRFRQTGSRLEVFSLRTDSMGVDIDDLDSLHIFLASFAGLQFLEVRWDLEEDPPPSFDVSCIQGHMPTLTDLYLSFLGMDGSHSHCWYIDISCVEKLVQQSPKLRQVALPFSVNANYQPGDFNPILGLLLASSQIRVLQLLEPPSFDQQARMEPSRDRLDDFANKLMRKIARDIPTSGLELLCIGNRRPWRDDSSETRDDEDGRSYYLRGTQTPCFGCTRPAGIHVPERQLRLEYPLMDVYTADYRARSCLGAADYNLLGRRGA